MQAAMEERKINVVETSKIYLPTTTKELTAEQEAEVMAMIERWKRTTT